MNRNPQNLEPPGENRGTRSNSGNTTAHAMSTSNRTDSILKHSQDNHQNVTVMPNQDPRFQNIRYQPQPLNDHLMRQPASINMYSGASDARYHMPPNGFPSQQPFQMQQHVYDPNQHLHRYANLPAQMQHHLHVQPQIILPQAQLNHGINVPQIQLSQRQMELLAARSHMRQQQTPVIVNHAPANTVEKNQKNQYPVFLSRSNVNDHNAAVKQDPPDKATRRAAGLRDPPSAASVVMSTVVDQEENENETKNTTQTEVCTGQQNENAEQQRKFLRNLLQKAGTQSIASSSTSNTKASKDLVKKVLMKGASNLSGLKAKDAVLKSSSAGCKKSNSLKNRDLTIAASGSSLRERWFKRKGIEATISQSLSLSQASSTSTIDRPDNDEPVNYEATCEKDLISENRSPHSSIEASHDKHAPGAVTLPKQQTNDHDALEQSNKVKKYLTIQKPMDQSGKDSYTGRSYHIEGGAQFDKNTKSGPAQENHLAVNISNDRSKPGLASDTVHGSLTCSNPNRGMDAVEYLNQSVDAPLDEGFATFMESLQKEVFSGQFTQLWTSFSSLLMDDNEQAVELVNKYGSTKQYKVDTHTKQILKELNHHAKKYNNVECVPRSQLMNDKKFNQEFPEKKIHLILDDYKGQRQRHDDLISATRSISPDNAEEGASTIDHCDSTFGQSQGTFSKRLDHQCTSSAEYGVSLQMHRKMKPLADDLYLSNQSVTSLQVNVSHSNSQQKHGRIKSLDDATDPSSDSMGSLPIPPARPSLHVITSAVQTESERKSSQPLVKEKSLTVQELGNAPKNPWPSAPSASSSSSSSIPWLDGRDYLRQTDGSLTKFSSSRIVERVESKISPVSATAALRNESIHLLPSKHPSEPAWTKVTLRHVEVGDRSVTSNIDRRKVASSFGNDTPVEGIVSLSHLGGDGSTESNFLPCKEPFQDGNRSDSAVIIRLAEAGDLHNESPGEVKESRVIVGKTILMRVQSFPGQSQASVQWKLSRKDIESVTLDMTKKQVKLKLLPNDKLMQNLLDFESQEDCLKFANAYYEMSTKIDETQMTSDTTSLSESAFTGAISGGSVDNSFISLPDTVDISMRLESLSDEEQNVLETYRRLRQTKAAGEALNESISKNNVEVSNSIPIGTMQHGRRLEGFASSVDNLVSAIASNAPPQFVEPPDLPSSPVSTFSNSVCTAATAEDEKVAEKYKKMLKLKVPLVAVQHKMTMDNVDPKVVAIVLGNDGNRNETGDELTFSSNEKEQITKYKKMLQLGLSEEVVRHKMKQEQVSDEKLFKAVFEEMDDSQGSEPNLSEHEKADIAKYRHFLKVGMSEEAVRHKMAEANVDQKLIQIIFAKEGVVYMNKCNDDVPTGEANQSHRSRQKLSEEEESVASHYRKMLKLQIPKDAVLSRMEKEGISHNIITSVVGGPFLLSKSKAKQPTNENKGFSSSASSTGSNLINFHWNVLSGPAIPGSVWDKVTVTDANNGDVTELIELFQKRSNVTTGRTGAKFADDVSSGGSSKAKLLDLTRSNNIAISLKSFKEFSFTELADIIAYVNPLRRIQGERSQFIRDLLPTVPELRLIEAFDGTVDRLVPAELWFRHLIGIRRIETKAHVIRTMELFSSEVESASSNFNLLRLVCRQVIDSERLQILLQAVLIIGNKLNEGTRNGDAAGFRFDSLLRLTQTKASDGKTTALDYLVKEFAEKGQRNTLVLTEDFPECQTASRMLISDMTNEVNILRSALDQCNCELSAMKKELDDMETSPATKPNSQTNRFSKPGSKDAERIHLPDDRMIEKQRSGVLRLSTFIESVEDSFSRLQDIRDSTLQACKDLAKYSGEPGGQSATTSILGILAEFASNVGTALKKYDEQLRTTARKQKAQDSKEVVPSLSNVESSTMQTSGKGKSLVLLINDVLKNANPQFREDFKKGRFVPNPSDALKTIYEKEKILKVLDECSPSIGGAKDDTDKKCLPSLATIDSTSFRSSGNMYMKNLNSTTATKKESTIPFVHSSESMLPNTIWEPTRDRGAGVHSPSTKTADETVDSENTDSERHDTLREIGPDQRRMKEHDESGKQSLGLSPVQSQSQESTTDSMGLGNNDNFICNTSNVVNSVESKMLQSCDTIHSRDADQSSIFPSGEATDISRSSSPAVLSAETLSFSSIGNASQENATLPSKRDSKVESSQSLIADEQVTSPVLFHQNKIEGNRSDVAELDAKETHATSPSGTTAVLFSTTPNRRVAVVLSIKDSVDESKTTLVANSSIGRLLDPNDDEASETLHAISEEQSLESEEAPLAWQSTMQTVPDDNSMSSEDDFEVSVSVDEVQTAEQAIDNSVEEQEQTPINDDVVFDISFSKQRLNVLDSVTSKGTKRSVSDVVKSLQQYTKAQQGKELFNASLKNRKSCPSPYASARHPKQPVKARDNQLHQVHVSTNIDKQKESQVSRMARLKREEKNRVARKSSPLPPKQNLQNTASTQSICASASSQTIIHTGQVLDFSDDVEKSILSSTAESAMSRLARQKRIDKRMSR